MRIMIEADDSVSKKEFSKMHWDMQKRSARKQSISLRMIARAVPELKSDARELWIEARSIAFDLRKDLEEWKRQMTKHAGAYLSSLVIRA